MAEEFVFVQGNRRPYFEVQLKNRQDDAPIDLTGCTVAFFMKNKRSREVTVNGAACTVTDVTNGKVRYQWGANDLNKHGVYDAEFRVTFPGAETQSVLIEGVVVKEKLG